MKHNRWYSDPTQVYWTCKNPIDGRTISAKTEIRKEEGCSLGAKVDPLPDKYDWPIITKPPGSGSVAKYHLAPGTDRIRLRFPPSAKQLAEEGGAA